MKYDVIVVGAGPVGSYISKNLSEKGLKVLLLEKKQKPGKKACSGIIGTEAFKRFNLPENPVVSRIDTIRITSPSGKTITYKHPENMANVVDRMRFDRLMLSEAISRGVEYWESSKVLYISNLDGHVGVRFLRRRKDQHVVGRIAVLSTGFNPHLLKPLGLSYRDFFEGAQVEGELVKNIAFPEVFPGGIFGDGFGWILPLGDGRAKIGAVARSNAGKKLLHFVNDLIEKGIFRNPGTIHIAFIPSSPINKTYKDKVLLVGEVAGQVKPTTLGGIYYGLICASHAVNTILKAFEKGNFSEETLSTYEASWKMEIGNELKWGKRIRKFLRLTGSRGVEKLIELFSSKTKLLNPPIIKFDWHSNLIKYLLNLLDFKFNKL